MGLQPHAEKELDEKVKVWMDLFKAGFACGAEGQDLPVEPQFEEFVAFVQRYDPMTADYIKQELW